jgi:hypothetical protein
MPRRAGSAPRRAAPLVVAPPAAEAAARRAAPLVVAPPAAEAEPPESAGSEPNRSAAGPDDFQNPDARVVYTRVTLLRIEDVNTVSQTWSAELYHEFVFSLRRDDDRQVVQELAASGFQANVDSRHPFAAVFWPKISHAKGDETDPDEIWVRRLKGEESKPQERALCAAIAAEERVSAQDVFFFSFSLRAVRTFSQSFQLELFPLDMQLLVARIVLNQSRREFRFALKDENERVWGKQAKGARWETAINAVNGALSPMMSEWRLRKRTVTRSCVSSKETSRSGTQCACCFSRRPPAPCFLHTRARARNLANSPYPTRP